MNQTFTLKLLALASVVLSASSQAWAQPNAAQVHQPGSEKVTMTSYHPNSTAKSTATGSRVTAYSMYKYNYTSGSFLSSDSSSYLYSSPGNANTSQLYAFTSTGTAWTPSKQFVYTYNAAGFMTSMVEQHWNTSTSAYVNFSKVTNTLNAGGFATDVVYSTWTSGAWVNSTHAINTYNASNKLKTEVYQSWNVASATWVPYYRYTYTRNAAGLATTKLGEGWNATPGNWVNDSKTDSNFNGTGTGLVSIDMWQWVGNSNWAPASRWLYTLNGAGKIATFINQGYAMPTSTFFNSQKFTYTYDAAGNDTVLIGQNWDFMNNTWEADLSKTVFTYNTYNQITSSASSVYKSGVWTYDGYCKREKYYYQTYTVIPNNTAVPQIASGIQLCLSPQPAHDVLNIAFKVETPQDVDVSIIDMQGRVQQRFIIKDATNVSQYISVSEMLSGNYILAINGGHEVHLTRMITIAH